MIRDDTICAPATAMGRAGVSVIRISGAAAHNILDSIFLPLNKKEMRARELVLGDIHDGSTVIDRAMAVKFFAPNSYTGEDIAEIHAHGGEMTAKLVMRAAMSAGAVPAEPGEFSKRAFLNGKMDVSQAEAVQDLISGMSEKSAEMAAKNLCGDIFEEIKHIQNSLKNVLAAIDAGIEYPEEDLEESIAESQLPHIRDIKSRISKLIFSYDSGRKLREGAVVAIAGDANVGKSSLLNAFLGEDRAIVTDIPGTTRDILTEAYDLRGIPVIFYDTAGIRDTEDAVEKIGVERAKKTFDDAAVVLMLFDASDELSHKNTQLFFELRDKCPVVIPVLNKTDLDIKTPKHALAAAVKAEPICISAYEKTGIDILLDKLYDAVLPDSSLIEGVVISNARHKNALVKAERAIDDALAALDTGVSLDCVTIDLMDAWQSLGEITGETLTEDIIDSIFENFCLGK